MTTSDVGLFLTLTVLQSPEHLQVYCKAWSERRNEANSVTDIAMTITSSDSSSPLSTSNWLPFQYPQPLHRPFPTRSRTQTPSIKSPPPVTVKAGQLSPKGCSEIFNQHKNSSAISTSIAQPRPKLQPLQSEVMEARSASRPLGMKRPLPNVSRLRLQNQLRRSGQWQVGPVNIANSRIAKEQPRSQNAQRSKRTGQTQVWGFRAEVRARIKEGSRTRRRSVALVN